MELQLLVYLQGTFGMCELSGGKGFLWDLCEFKLEFLEVEATRKKGGGTFSFFSRIKEQQKGGKC